MTRYLSNYNFPEVVLNVSRTNCQNYLQNSSSAVAYLQVIWYTQVSTFSVTRG